MSGNPERTQALRQYVQEQVKKFRAGEVTELPTNRFLALRFGYTVNTGFSDAGSGLLTGTDLPAERKLLREMHQNIKLVPSPSMGWLLGVLAGRGHVDLGSRNGTSRSGGEISLTVVDSDLLREFKLTGETLFRINATTGGNKRSCVRFAKHNLAVAMGSFKNGVWPETVMERHRWVLEDINYTRSFLTGFLDSSGNLNMYPSNVHRIILSTPVLSDANMLADMLLRVGIENAHILRDRNYTEGIKGVGVSDLNSIIKFAKQIHSRIPAKEKRLKYYRGLSYQRGLNRRFYSDEEIIEQWQNAVIELGHNPSVGEVEMLRNNGKISVSSGTIKYRFGQGSFTKARETLGQMVEST